MRSMDMAPRDGTRIIIRDGDDGLTQCVQWNGWDWIVMPDPEEVGCDIVIDNPIGWAPLPVECFEEGANK